MIWGQVHVGDTVRGADGGTWVIAERMAGQRWLGSGVESARFVVCKGERRITLDRQLSDEAPIISAADHRMMASAVGAIFAGFPEALFMSETINEQPEAPSMPKTEINVTLPTQCSHPPQTVAASATGGARCDACGDTLVGPIEDPCAHPAESLSTLKTGTVHCTACGIDVPGALPAETPTPDGSKGGEAILTGVSLPAVPDEPGNPVAVPEALEHRIGDVVTVAGVELTKVGDDPFAMPGPAPRSRPEAPKGQWGWYKLPHPVTGERGYLWPRVSTIKTTLADRYGIERWEKRLVVKGVATSPDIIASAIASNVDEDKSFFNDLAQSALDRARAMAKANYGTAVHKFAERRDDGESVEGMGVPAELRADIEAYARALRVARLRVVPELTERVIVNADHEYAGRWDRIVEDEAGRRYVLDLKSGGDVLEYAGLENATQQAMYAHGTHLTTPDFAGYEPMPTLDLDKAFILHMPLGTGTAIIYGIDIIKGWRTALRSIAVRQDRKDARDGGWMWVYSPGTPAEAVRLRIGRASTLDELMEATSQAGKMALFDAELQAYALARYDLIRALTATHATELAALYDELHPANRWTLEVASAAHDTFTRINQPATA